MGRLHNTNMEDNGYDGAHQPRSSFSTISDHHGQWFRAYQVREVINIYDQMVRTLGGPRGRRASLSNLGVGQKSER